MPDYEHQRNLLAELLGAVMTELGVLNPDAPFTGPQLLLAAMEWLKHRNVVLPSLPSGRLVEIPESGVFTFEPHIHRGRG